MGRFTRQLLPHRDLDESPHGANIYILGMEPGFAPSVYEREPDTGFD